MVIESISSPASSARSSRTCSTSGRSECGTSASSCRGQLTRRRRRRCWDWSDLWRIFSWPAGGTSASAPRPNPSPESSRRWLRRPPGRTWPTRRGPRSRVNAPRNQLQHSKVLQRKNFEERNLKESDKKLTSKEW